LSTAKLNPVSYVVLALVGDGGAGAHDIVRMLRQGGPVYWEGAPSRLYAEPKRLVQLGYLTASSEPGQTHARTVYRLTPSGRDALREWLAEPARFPRIKNEPHLRLLAGDLLTDDEIVASFRGMLPELDALGALVEQMYAQAETVPHRTTYLRLSHAYARRLIALHRDWVAEVESTLAPGGTGTRTGR
jgi:DNA-binding PadR family transcriptional regulator